MVSPFAPRQIQDLILTENQDTFDIAQVAEAAVLTQLSLYDEHQSKTQARAKSVPSMFDTVAKRIADSIGDDPEEDAKLITELPTGVSRKALWKWTNLPYSVFCEVAASVSDAEPTQKRMRGESDTTEAVADVDEWFERVALLCEFLAHSNSLLRRILRNENWLLDNKSEDWTRGLVKLSKQANAVFRNSTLTETARTIKRPKLAGYTFLDQKRAPSIQIQPSVDAFAQKFSELTGDLLKGLSWDNVFIAGGIVAGSLFCVDQPDAIAKPEQWKHSDIDIYLYGLGPAEANEKIKHIFSVFKSNLPPDAPALVVRNSRTITFFSNYPTKRIQIVLKLVKDPKEVLLNFDLDVCALGWDGKEVWMLPRAARALESVFIFYHSLNPP